MKKDRDFLLSIWIWGWEMTIPETQRLVYGLLTKLVIDVK